ncbi:MAG: methionyl-tRNA formyltransferase [Microgenomates group bacterium]
MNIIFFGSTEDSVIVARTLHGKYPLSAVVTQPEKPVGRDKIITKTPLALWAIEQKLPCLTFVADEEQGWKYKNDDDVTNSLATFKPDLFVTACYGQKLPSAALKLPKHGSINLHPSLLPRWRGADPVPWTIIAGDAQTGVTISIITDSFDSGDIVAQKKIPITEHDLPDPLRTKLFTIGAQLLLETLPTYFKGNSELILQKKEDVLVARKLTRTDGFVPFPLITIAIAGTDATREKRLGTVLQEITEPLPEALLRLLRALSPWPGIWTTVIVDNQEKRLKLLDYAVRDGKLSIKTVQLEGKNPVDWETFQTAYLHRV